MRRATAFWQAQVEQAWAALYDFQIPELREAETRAEFTARVAASHPLAVSTFEFGQVVTDGDWGWVEVTFTSTLRKFPALPPRDS
ncbi:MAG: hypothetical protein ACE5GE_04075, partial [Phycisphaerae bacterium]